ncbi:hypothetical protein [Acidovorax sp. Root267]|uniref:hypothetical protein n=1 Tax=Acidovorax sp. Root267 TaxID=1736505 RepID=UPI000A76E2A8|nr:hypothetical protein [Acidovorax sp. Root267]
MPSILLIDDTAEELEGLAAALRSLVLPTEALVITWQPSKQDEKEPVELLEDFLRPESAHDVRFVVTDYDLTRKGALGLYGSTVVDQCQLRAIPVGDYSRGNASRLPKEPNLFEIRIPTKDYETAASFIANVFRGFQHIRETVKDLNPMPRSPAAGIAAILDRPMDQNRFSQYGTRYPLVNSGLVDRTAPTGSGGQREAMLKLFAYVTGHVLINLVLRYPGPIISREGLAAHCGISEVAVDQIESMFEACKYAGPFEGVDHYFWMDGVQSVLESLEPGDVDDTRTIGELNRAALEKHLNIDLPRHSCSRCDGRNGGFYCPFTKRAVCLQNNCSVGSNGWIPPGARLCRIEKDYFDDWSPLLGL